MGHPNAARGRDDNGAADTTRSFADIEMKLVRPTAVPCSTTIRPNSETPHATNNAPSGPAVVLVAGSSHIPTS